MGFRPTRRALVGGAAALAGLGVFRMSGFTEEPGRRRIEGLERPPSLPFVGINLAGAEFGRVPGTYDTDYTYPRRDEVAYFAGLGFNCFRLPFKWERLQPDLLGPLTLRESGRLTTLVREITSAGHFALIDPHNYARRRIRSDSWSTEYAIGSRQVPSEAFLDFWTRLGQLFRDDDRVLLGLMNEPFGVPAAVWLRYANGAIAAIRSAGARNLITVPGTAWSGAHSWLREDNGALAGVVDPLRNFAVEVHQYFDDDSSGTTPKATSGTCGSERLAAFQSWARENGIKAFLGEFAAAANPASLNALRDICEEMSANADVWLGWTAWAAGPWWPQDDMFFLGPGPGGALREQTRILAAHARPSSPSWWTKPGASIDVDLGRGRVHGCRDLADVIAFSTPRAARAGPAPGPMAMRGPLLDLIAQPAFTLLIETQGLADPSTECDIVSTVYGPVLRRTKSGALRAAWGGDQMTGVQPLENWRGRRRSALSVQRSPGRIAVGATGAVASSGPAQPWFVDGATMATAGGGSILRITGFPSFMDRDEVDVLTS